MVLAGLAATTHPRPQATKHPPPLWPLLGLPLRLWLRCPGLLFEETAAASCKAPERPPAPPYPSARVWESPCPTLGPEERSPSPPARLRPPLRPRYWGQQQVVRLEVQPRDLLGTLRALACPCLGVA